MQNFQSLGQNTFTDLVIAPTTHSFNVNATKVWGAHTMKIGSDYRKFLLNFTQLFFPSGQFAFNNAQWTQRNPERVERHAGSRAGLDAARHPDQRQHEPQSGSRVVQRVLVAATCRMTGGSRAT